MAIMSRYITNRSASNHISQRQYLQPLGMALLLTCVLFSGTPLAYDDMGEMSEAQKGNVGKAFDRLGEIVDKLKKGTDKRFYKDIKANIAHIIKEGHIHPANNLSAEREGAGDISVYIFEKQDGTAKETGRPHAFFCPEGSLVMEGPKDKVSEYLKKAYGKGGKGYGDEVARGVKEVRAGHAQEDRKRRRANKRDTDTADAKVAEAKKRAKDVTDKIEEVRGRLAEDLGVTVKRCPKGHFVFDERILGTSIDESTEEGWCKIHYLMEIIVHEKLHEYFTRISAKAALKKYDESKGTKLEIAPVDTETEQARKRLKYDYNREATERKAFWRGASKAIHKDVYKLQERLRKLQKKLLGQEIAGLNKARGKTKKGSKERADIDAQLKKLDLRIKDCLKGGQKIVSEKLYSYRMVIHEPGECVATTTYIDETRRTEETYFVSAPVGLLIEQQPIGEISQIPECMTTPPVITFAPPEKVTVPVDGGTPTRVTKTPRTEEPDEFPDPDEDAPNYGLVKVGKAVMDLVISTQDSGKPYEDVMAKTLEPAPELPLLASVDPALMDNQHYASDVTGGISDAGGDVPIAFTTVEEDPFISDKKGPVVLADASNGDVLVKNDPPKAKPTTTKPAKDAPLVLDKPVNRDSSGKLTEGTVFDQEGVDKKTAKIKGSPVVKGEPKVPPLLEKTKSKKLISRVAPETPKITGPKAKDKKYSAPKRGVRVETTIGLTHVPGDQSMFNTRGYEIIIRVGPAKVRWRSGDACGEFKFKKGSRTYVKGFKANESTVGKATFTDLDISGQDLGEMMEEGLPKGDLAGSAPFEVEIERRYQIITRKEGEKDPKKWSILEDGKYKRAFKGRLREIPKEDAWGGDRSGKYELEYLETMPKGPDAKKECKKPKDSSGVSMPLKGTVALASKNTVQLAITLDKKDAESLPIAYVQPGSEICVSHSFGIGERSVVVVQVPVDGQSEFTETVSRDTSVVTVEVDPCRKKEGLNDPFFGSSGLWGQDYDDQWAIKRVGFDDSDKSAWKSGGNKTEPVTVAVIDTGLDWYHPDLDRKNIWLNSSEVAGNNIDDDGNGYVDDMVGWNFIDNDNSPWDYDGHGTFVSGVIAAAQANGKGIAGINPHARIMVLRALDAFGQGHASMVAEAITYAADNGARVINLSLAGRDPTTMEKLAIEHARSKGALIVVAAGNQAQKTDKFAPAGMPGVVTVSASDQRDRRAGFSNWGPAVDIAAPGIDILSLRARNTDLLSFIRNVEYEIGKGVVGKNRAYFRASGTSFAAPIVAGTASLILSKRPELSADQVRNMLLNSAGDIDTPGIDNYSGFGLLNATAALAANPDYYLDGRISGVKVTRVRGKPVLRILGRMVANELAKGNIYLGKGGKPQKWLKVKIDLTKPVEGGPLLDLPSQLLKSSKQWTIRLIVTHKDGSIREARFSLKLG